MSSSSSSAPSSPKTSNNKRKHAVGNVDSDISDADSGSGSDSEDDKPASVVEDDIPVLSHAAKRKQKREEEKRKRKQESNEEDTIVMKKKRKLKNGSAAAAPQDVAGDKGLKRQNSTWVGNMTFKTTEENLRTFFKDRGVGEVTRIHMPMKAAKGPGLKMENRGFAYVDFDTPEAKHKAIALSEQPLLGRKLLIKDGDDFTGRPNQAAVETMLTVNGVRKSLSKSAQKILRNQKQPPAPTLFFGNLGFDTTEDSIRELLEAHRERGKEKEKPNEAGTKSGEEEKGESWIRKVRMGTFEDSGKCKGFAFVDFGGTEHATSALVNPKNHHLNGRGLVVEYASAEAVRRGAPKVHKPKAQADHTILNRKSEKKPVISKGLIQEPQQFGRVDKKTTVDVDVPADDVAPGLAFAPKFPERDSQRNRENKGKPRGRPKPGAALALAKRESAAIVPSQGQKITF